jgi:hypothetical protein
MKKQQLATVQPSPLDVVKPKPTKAELLEAMVMLRIEEIGKEATAAIDERDRLKNEADEAVRDFFSQSLPALTPCIDLGRARRDWDSRKGRMKDTYSVAGAEVKFALDPLPKVVQETLLAYHMACIKVESLRFTPDGIRKQIREAIKNGGKTPKERVEALVTDESSREALTAALKTLNLS